MLNLLPYWLEVMLCVQQCRFDLLFVTVICNAIDLTCFSWLENIRNAIDLLVDWMTCSTFDLTWLSEQCWLGPIAWITNTADLYLVSKMMWTILLFVFSSQTPNTNCQIDVVMFPDLMTGSTLLFNKLDSQGHNRFLFDTWIRSFAFCNYGDNISSSDSLLGSPVRR